LTFVITEPPEVPIVTLLLPFAIDDAIETLANTPLPYNMLLALPSLLIVAILPIPLTFATATLFATDA
jgi:hypothetical protein